MKLGLFATSRASRYSPWSGASASEPEATSGTRQLRQRVVGALQLTRAPGVGFQRRLLPSGLVRSRLDRLVQPAFGWPAILNASELACVLGWPIGNPTIEGVSYSGHRQLPPTSGTTIREARSSSRVTGRATFPGSEGLLHLPEQAGLHHLHVLGPTGTGKSTFLANLALQDIAVGRGVVVIDPGAKGDLVRDIADRIPKHRQRDVVLLDPSDEVPVGLNVLSASEPELAVDAVVHVFHELWAAHWGPRTADVLHHGLLTLARTPGMTLCELPPLLLNAGFRQRVLQQLGSDALGVGPFWGWYQALSDAERAAVVGPVLNKLRAFTQREAIRSVIGQDGGIDLNTVIRERKVLLVNLASGTLGSETAQLLGALIMAKLWQAIAGRSAVVAAERRPVFVYIDEFQQTLRLPMDLTDALVQARGLGVGLVLAHQHLGQLTPAVKSSLLSNAGSRVVFGLRATDGAAMAKEMGSGITAEDLQGLPAYETYQSLHIVGGRSRPASARTLPLTPSLGSGERVRSHLPQLLRHTARPTLMRHCSSAETEPSPMRRSAVGSAEVRHEGLHRDHRSPTARPACRVGGRSAVLAAQSVRGMSNRQRLSVSWRFRDDAARRRGETAGAAQGGRTDGAVRTRSRHPRRSRTTPVAYRSAH